MSLWSRCSPLEKYLFWLSHICMFAFAQFIPVLWDGIFTAKNTPASNLYLAGVVLIIICCFFALTFDWALYEDWRKQRAIRKTRE